MSFGVPLKPWQHTALRQAPRMGQPKGCLLPKFLPQALSFPIIPTGSQANKWGFGAFALLWGRGSLGERGGSNFKHCGCVTRTIVT